MNSIRATLGSTLLESEELELDVQHRAKEASRVPFAACRLPRAAFAAFAASRVPRAACRVPRVSVRVCVLAWVRMSVRGNMWEIRECIRIGVARRSS